MFSAPAVWLILSWLVAGGGLTRTACGTDGPAAPKRVAVTTIPYDLDRGPNPEGRTLQELLPAEVGPFARRPLESFGLPSDADLNVEYSDGRHVIVVGFVVAASLELAQCAVRAARDMARPPDRSARTRTAAAVTESLQGHVTFVKTDDFIAWNRGRHFFYVKADRADALDLFMAHFTR